MDFGVSKDNIGRGAGTASAVTVSPRFRRAGFGAYCEIQDLTLAAEKYFSAHAYFLMLPLHELPGL